jgi:FG-GAP-like repeat/FG-GAP repeat
VRARRLALALAAALALAPAGLAGAALVVGVNDEAALDPGTVGWFYPTMGAEGLQVSTIALRWDDGAPAAIPDQAAVARALTAAAANGQTVELDLFPLHSQVFTGAAACAPSTDPQACGNTAEIQAFAAWTAQVARAFPAVSQFVVMNECNQPLFVNPQWDGAGQNQSAEICGRALAAAYDAIKAVNGRDFVWGVGLSPRGNDNPNAKSDSSTTPVTFLHALGTWFKAFAQATGRTKPLMDGLDFHPYPIPQSQPFAQGYQVTTEASVSNLPRIYQAFYDGFEGSPQPTIGQQAGGGLPVSLNEVGIQTDSSGHAGYVGTETSANSAGGVLGQYATEAYQSSWYLQMLNLLACDPNVRLVDIYHLIDEASLAGWQSGLYYLDRTPKESAAAVHDWIAATGGACQGAEHPWTPAGVPAAAQPPSGPAAAPSRARIVVASAGRIRILDAVTHALRRVLAPFGTGYTGPISLALGDVNHDGVADIAVGEGPGGSPVVKILNGKTGRAMQTYEPFPASFRGGVSVALGDVDSDGRADLVVGTGAGATAQVKVYSGKTRALLETLTPFGAAFRGGVSVAAGDVNGDGAADVIVGTGPGGSARVEVLAGDTGAVIETLAPFAASFHGGVAVAAGDVDGDGRDDVIAATGPGVAAQVKVYRDGTKIRLKHGLGLFEAFGPAFSGGVAVAAADLNGDGRADVVLGAGAGGGSQVKVLDGATGGLLSSFLGASGSAAIAVGAG